MGRLYLNGFSIVGPEVCSGTPPSLTCTPPGASDGIHCSGFANLAITNGTVRGFARSGINAGLCTPVRVERVGALSNGAVGILVGFNGIVEKSTASNNGQDGIAAGAGSAISASTAFGNKDAGFNVDVTVLTGNTASGNGIVGFFVEGGVLANNVANANVGDGIDVDENVVAVGNSAMNNGVVGIVAANAASLIANAVGLNSGLGLQMANLSGYANNVVSNNNGGNANPQTSGGVQIGTNLCRGTTTCP